MNAIAQRVHFTKGWIERLPAPTDGKPATYFDDSPKELAIRVQPSGTKTFFVLKRTRGKTERFTLGTFPNLTIENARKHALAKLSDVADWRAGNCKGVSPMARPIDPEVLTVSKALDMYILGAVIPNAREKGKDPAKAEQRRRDLFGWYAGTLRNRDVTEITEHTMVKLHDDLTASAGPVAANRTIELLRAIFNYLLGKKLVPSDPTQAVTLHNEKARSRFLQPDELVKLFAAIEVERKERNADVCDFVLLLLATGVRKSNLYAANYHDISFALGTWTVPGEQSKNGQPLTIMLTKTAMKILKARYHANAYVFPSQYSKSGHVVDFKNEFTKLVKRAGISERVTMHDLRRTNGSYQAISGASLAIVGESLGHKDVASTEVYARLNKSAVRESMEAGETKMLQLMEAEKTA